MDVNDNNFIELIDEYYTLISDSPDHNLNVILKAQWIPSNLVIKANNPTINQMLSQLNGNPGTYLFSLSYKNGEVKLHPQRIEDKVLSSEKLLTILDTAAQQQFPFSTKILINSCMDQINDLILPNQIAPLGIHTLHLQGLSAPSINQLYALTINQPQLCYAIVNKTVNGPNINNKIENLKSISRRLTRKNLINVYTFVKSFTLEPCSLIDLKYIPELKKRIDLLNEKVALMVSQGDKGVEAALISLKRTDVYSCNESLKRHLFIIIREFRLKINSSNHELIKMCEDIQEISRVVFTDHSTIKFGLFR